MQSVNLNMYHGVKIHCQLLAVNRHGLYTTKTIQSLLLYKYCDHVYVSVKSKDLVMLCRVSGIFVAIEVNFLPYSLLQIMPHDRTLTLVF